ncbi:MAG TPA: hypothetical protein VK886_07400 [Vicinamibacterales bacterium]|nr:hypothetical protein [Vicinamibacterales bacterium]
MRIMNNGNLRRAALGVAGVGALVVTAACGTSANGGARALGYQDGMAQPVSQPFAASAPASGQVLVNCEPHQRTLVRQAMVNGQPVAQVECVTAAAPVYGAAAYGVAAPADYGYDTRVVQPAVVQPAVVQSAPVYRETRPRTVTQRRAVTVPASSGRSVKKSAIIIGSSAGIGAGVGAAVGGKKGALIGAAIGGGSAAIWDQVTRRK